MAPTLEEESLWGAIRALDPGLQEEIGRLYGRGSWDPSDFYSAKGRQKLRDWVEDAIDRFSSYDSPRGLLKLRTVLLHLRNAKGDLDQVS